MSLRRRLALGLVAVLATWTVVLGGLEAWLVLGLSPAASAQALPRVMLIEAALLVGLLCMAAARLARILEPVQRLASAAEEIVHSGSLSRPLPMPTGADEAGRIALALNELMRKVDALVTGQRRMLADTSHELRNPLTVIRTNVDMLGRDVDADMRREIVEETEAEIARMTRMVDDLVKLSTAETTPPAHPEAIRLDMLVSEVVDRIRTIAAQRTITLEVGAHVVAMGDADRLKQVITNLVSNAVRYTRAGGTIAVSVRHAEGRARIAVQDDGIGIPAKHLPHVFDRFYRVDEARARASGGAGLGLPIARALAESHGGTIEVTSEEGRGSCFTFVVPAEPAQGLATTRMPRTRGAAS